MGREVVVAVTNGRLDGSTGLAEVFGTWERIFQGQAERLARESRRTAAEAGIGQDYRGVDDLPAVSFIVFRRCLTGWRSCSRDWNEMRRKVGLTARGNLAGAYGGAVANA